MYFVFRNTVSLLQIIFRQPAINRNTGKGNLLWYLVNYSESIQRYHHRHYTIPTTSKLTTAATTTILAATIVIFIVMIFRVFQWYCYYPLYTYW